MKRLPAADSRVLAIEPSTKGFGFAVMEGPEQLIDWGLKVVRGDKNSECLKKVAQLIDRYSPDLIVTEDYRHKNSRRSRRVRRLLKAILALASKKKVRGRSVSRAAVRTAFSQDSSAPTKHSIAIEIAKLLPELTPRLPRLRKPWMREDERMSVFDAIGWGLTLLGRKDSQEEV